MSDFKATILKKNQNQTELKIKVTHSGNEHLIEVKDKWGYKLYLNNYQLGHMQLLPYGKALVEGYTMGLIKPGNSFKFEIVEGEKRYKSKLKFKQDSDRDYYGINLIIDGNVILHKEVSNSGPK